MKTFQDVLDEVMIDDGKLKDIQTQISNLEKKMALDPKTAGAIAQEIGKLKAGVDNGLQLGAQETVKQEARKKQEEEKKAAEAKMQGLAPKPKPITPNGFSQVRATKTPKAIDQIGMKTKIINNSK